MNLKLKVKSIIFLILIITIEIQAQSPVESITGVPSNNADNATGKQNAIWRNSVIAPQNSSFPNQQNWWSIFQTQFFDTRYDAQLAFGLNQQDLWLR